MGTERLDDRGRGGDRCCLRPGRHGRGLFRRGDEFGVTFRQLAVFEAVGIAAVAIGHHHPHVVGRDVTATDVAVIIVFAEEGADLFACHARILCQCATRWCVADEDKSNRHTNFLQSVYKNIFVFDIEWLCGMPGAVGSQLPGGGICRIAKQKFCRPGFEEQEFAGTEPVIKDCNLPEYNAFQVLMKHCLAAAQGIEERFAILQNAKQPLREGSGCQNCSRNQ